ncbi:hypothetical protein FB451DRAFT_1172895 [Mycena latifolia]|nr:hypothetical protein FB451DRAFT_1172895 [Mycena latifolia]
MQFKSLLLPLVVLATGSNIQASTTAFSTFYTRDVALAGRTLVARTTTTQVTGTTVTVTKTVAKPTTTSSSSDCCECITALAEGVACAAAILEEGCSKHFLHHRCHGVRAGGPEVPQLHWVLSK